MKDFDLSQLRANWDRAYVPHPEAIPAHATPIEVPVDTRRIAFELLERVVVLAEADCGAQFQVLRPLLEEAWHLLGELYPEPVATANQVVRRSGPRRGEVTSQLHTTLQDLEDLLSLFMGIGLPVQTGGNSDTTRGEKPPGRGIL